MTNKKYNPKDYKDAEFITLGDGPIRIQIVKAGNLMKPHYKYVAAVVPVIEYLI